MQALRDLRVNASAAVSILGGPMSLLLDNCGHSSRVLERQTVPTCVSVVESPRRKTDGHFVAGACPSPPAWARRPMTWAGPASRYQELLDAGEVENFVTGLPYDITVHKKRLGSVVEPKTIPGARRGDSGARFVEIR
jgi:hypothetical protein